MNYLTKYPSEQISAFIISGSISSDIDSAGNVRLSTNETDIFKSCITFEIKYPNFDKSQILKYFDINFKELNSIQDEVQPTKTTDYEKLYEEKLDENNRLKDMLDGMLSDAKTISEKVLIKDTIIELRIKLKEGKLPTDFSDEFPYRPK